MILDLIYVGKSHFYLFSFPLRHSRFGGCYVIQGLKAIGDRDVVMHKGLHNVSHFKLLCASLERVDFFSGCSVCTFIMLRVFLQSMTLLSALIGN